MKPKMPFLFLADQSIFTSPTECLGAVDSQKPNMIVDGTGSQSAPWPGYELSFEDLKTRIRHQLEYYFSRLVIFSICSKKSNFKTRLFLEKISQQTLISVRKWTTISS